MSEHRGNTDSVHEVKLDSAIDGCLWLKPSVAAGDTVPLQVMTHLVGDGAEVKVEVRSKSGTGVGKVRGEIGRDAFTGSVVLPTKLSEDVYFEAELPKHGLKGRSGLLKVLPPRAITNARWDRETVKRGDTLKLEADINGLPDGTDVVVSIFEHDADGSHDHVVDLDARVASQKVSVEWEFEYVDDTDDIPSHDEAERGYAAPEYFFVVKHGSASAKSGLLKFQDRFEVRLVDGAGRPFKDMEYTIEMPDGTKQEGKLDEDGVLRLEEAPPGRAKLSFPKGLQGVGKGTR